MTGRRKRLQLDSCWSWEAEQGQPTGDVEAVVFDVHLVQPGFGGRVLDRNRSVLVVGDVGLGHFSRRHPNLALRTEAVRR